LNFYQLKKGADGCCRRFFYALRLDVWLAWKLIKCMMKSSELGRFAKHFVARM